MELGPIERRKVDRYLDVTKSALLFGGRILLVEGIAEALLLPAIAKHHTLTNDKDKLRLFRSAVFVPIDGVDFEPYATLLLTTVNDVRIADLVVIVTDGDKGTEGDSDEEDEEQPQEQEAVDAPAPGAAEAGKPVAAGTPGEQRRARLEGLAERLGARQHLKVVTSTYSLEAELLDAGNESILQKAYLALHPRSTRKWKEAVALSGDERAKRIHQIFKATRKGDFAQVLAGFIEDGEDFKVPRYIATAIEAVVAP